MELELPDGRIVAITDRAQLKMELSGIEGLPDGSVIELRANTKNTIRATRDAPYWFVTAKPRGWWFRQTLTTGDWIDRSMQKEKSFWKPRGDLTSPKVEKVFIEFFEGKKISQPILGAGGA